MRPLIVLSVMLLIGLGFVSAARADDDCGHVYDGRHSCSGGMVTVSWSLLQQQGCHPTFTIERKCGLNGTWTTLETDWDGISYTTQPPATCMTGHYFRITVHCSDCPGGDSIIIGPIYC